MSTAATIRLQIEATLAPKIPLALTPIPRAVRPVEPSGIRPLDEILQGGLPVGAISELVGPECSGRTSLALAFLAGITKAAKVCAWVDVSYTFDPASAAASGIDLERLLWVRCGVTEEYVERTTRPFSLPKQYLIPKPAKKGLHGGSFGPHPRGEVKGLPEAVIGLLHQEAVTSGCCEPQRRIMPSSSTCLPSYPVTPAPLRTSSTAPSARLEQALRSTDLLLQGGGFSAIVLDMGSLTPEVVARVPLATWFRYRAAAERTQSTIILLTQYACAKSSAGLLLRLQTAEPLREEATVFTGVTHRAEAARRRFAKEIEPIVLSKPPQRVNAAVWKSRTHWAGRR